MKPRIFPVLCVLLAVSVFALYGQVIGHEFVLYDDKQYIYQNSMVQMGLTPQSSHWAFSSLYASNWHPVTWLSHMLDHEIFGLNPGPQHLVNVLFHMLNSVLLFSVLRKSTGSTWRSFAVGALFAIHPIHVESVAWLAERKDVLSLFFGLLTIWSYIRYTQKLTARSYIPMVVFFALGLMAKPVLVSLPFILLLLDFWPLQRHRLQSHEEDASRPVSSTYRTSILLEKIPLFVLSIASGIITIYAQDKWGSIASIESHALLPRIANALVSYLEYLQKLLWPVDLAVIYPYPDFIGYGSMVMAALILIVASLLAVRKMSSCPYVFTGWFWFLGSMIPMIGIVQVGYQSMADRYTYLPFIGLYILLVWSVSDMFGRQRKALIALSVGVAAVLVTLTYQQIGYWKNSSSLFEHAIRVTDQNYVAYQHLAQVEMDGGRLDTALEHLTKAMEINPDDPKIHATLGNLYAKRGELPAAISSYKHALKINPKISEVYNNLGVAYYRLGNVVDSIWYYQKALQLNPDYSKAARNLEVSLQNLQNVE